MSKECQELNALYSQCVDGAAIRIPERLRTLPESSKDFIVDTMIEKAKAFAQKWQTTKANLMVPVDKMTDEERIKSLLGSERASMSEFQALQIAFRIAKRSSIDIARYYPMMNFSALKVAEKYSVCSMFDMDTEHRLMVWNRSVLPAQILSLLIALALCALI